jgi:hypothetical protein
VGSVLVGVLPLWGIAQIVLWPRPASLRESCFLGFMIGFALFAVTDLLSSVLRQSMSWQSLDPLAAITLGLAMAGVTCVVPAAIVVRVSHRSLNKKNVS